MFERSPLSGLKSRAAARAAVLRTRVTFMAVVHAMATYEHENLRHSSALAERRGRALETERQVADLLELRVRLKAALIYATSPGTVDGLHADIAANERETERAKQVREAELEAMNNQVAAIAIARERAANALCDAMNAAGIGAAALVDLVQLSGVPEAAEILSCANVSHRAARAATILEATKAEASRAAEELARMGSSAAYDAALLELLDAEDAHAGALRTADESLARERDAFRALSSAQRRLAAAERGAAAGPEEASRMGRGFDRPAVGEGSEPGAHQSGTSTVGVGKPASEEEQRRTGDSRTSGSGSVPGTQQTSGDPSGGLGLSIADTDQAAANGHGLHLDPSRLLTVTAPVVRS